MLNTKSTYSETGKPLRNSVAAEGILSYEFARSQSQAGLIPGLWNSLKDKGPVGGLLRNLAQFKL